MRKVPLKNYFFVIVIYIIIILVALYIFSWYKVLKEEKLMKSYLISSNTIQNYIDNIDNIRIITSEAPKEYFLYYSYRNDEEVYNFEKSFKRIIDKYKINDLIYYVDLTDVKDSDLVKLNIEKAPCLVYVDKKIKDVIYDLDTDIIEKSLINNNFKPIK